MTDETKDLSRRLLQYADGVTAFSILQFIGFTFNLSHGDCFTANIMGNPPIALIAGGAINAIYLGLILVCRRAQKSLHVAAHAGPGSSVVRIEENIWLARIISVIVVLALTMAVIGYVWWNMNGSQFHIVCKQS